MPSAHLETIASLGGTGDAVVDFLLDPEASLAELAGKEALVVRVAPPLPDARDGYGPAPRSHLWMRVTRGAPEVGLTGPDGGMVRRATRVDVEREDEPCCVTPGCDRRRAHVSVWVILEPLAEECPSRVLVAEERSLDSNAPNAPRGLAARIASSLASALGVPVSGSIGTVEDDPTLAPIGLLAAEEVGRFALRTEGERVVVRDWEGRGPRASAARNATIGGGLLLGALAAWAAFARSITTGQGTTEAAALGVVAALFTLAGVAFLGVARFSAQYAAPCTALLAIGGDRVIVLPWVGRDGAVDARPEGRLGAAIPLGDVRTATARPREEGFAVELDTDHGAIDAMVCATEKAAGRWAAAINRTLDQARHPKAAATARQRARGRAHT